MEAPQASTLPYAMQRALVALRISDSVSAALALARERVVHHFSVCHRGRVVGMVCACDLEQAASDRLVGEVMHPAVLLPDTRSTADAAMLMQAARVGSVLVTGQSGEPCGVVTRAELSAEPALAALFEDYRCPACGALHHLHQRGDRRPCSSCRHRTAEAHPRATSPAELSMSGE